jgi:anti-sigma B factor antagonist
MFQAPRDYLGDEKQYIHYVYHFAGVPMRIEKDLTNSSALIKIDGRIDSVTSSELKTALDELPADLTDLTLDFKNVPYISSAGLRVLLTNHKKMMATGTMKVINVSEDVMDVFEITGFKNVLNIE